MNEPASGWVLFWSVWLIIAAASFAVITAVVTVLGFRDLKNMFRLLRQSGEHRQ
jgi:hypothetical protein